MTDGEKAKDEARRVGLRRCPFCHEDVLTGEGALVTLCAGCHATHHQACWQESGACGACGATGRLEAVRDPLTRATAERVLTGAGYDTLEVARVLRGSRALPLAAVVLGAFVLLLLVFVRLQVLRSDSLERHVMQQNERLARAQQEIADRTAELRETQELLELASARIAEEERWIGTGPHEVVVQSDSAAFANGDQGLLKVFVGDEVRPGHFVASAEPRRTVVVPLYQRDERGERVRVRGGHFQLGDGPLVPFTTDGGDVFVHEGGALRQRTRR